MRNLTFLMLAAVLALGSAAQGGFVLDNMDDIVATGWIETRGTALMQQSTFAHEGTGSMRIAFEDAGAVWDIVPQRYFHAGNPPVSPPPHHNQLDMTNPDSDTLTFWVYADENAGDARIVQVILFCYTTGSPARFSVPLQQPGWNKIVAPASEFVVDGDDAAFIFSGIQTFQFWTSTWDTRGTSSLYIDDLQLVPEPATMTLLALGGVALLRRKRS